MVLLLLGASLLTFILIAASPIDPMEAFAPAESNISAEQRANIAEHWGLNEPPVERYLTWLGNIVQGEFGTSSTFKKPVTEVLAERVPGSVLLMVTAWVMSGVLGFVIGVICGARPGSWFDRIAKTFCFVLASTPVFWIGLILLMVFAVWLHWFPLGLAVPIGVASDDVTILDSLHHLLLPAIALSITGVANVALHTRQKLIDVLNSDYALFAKARGEGLWRTVSQHGLRNIAIPAVTVQFASFSELFGGSILAENVFSYPGIGSAASAAGLRGDIPLMLGIALFSVLFVFCGNLIANLLYGVLNPQIRERGGMQ
jgi:peptide/nickel transport system permease protein